MAQVIGKTMPHGFAGSYSRQPDMIVATHAAGGTENIPFGTPLKLSSGKVVAMGSGDTAAAFVGVAGREFKTALNYLNQNVGAYAPDEAVPVFERGRINVKVQKGTPALGGAVYVRVTANDSYPTAVVGGFEAEADSTKTVQLTNCCWNGAKDADGIAELTILTMYNPAVNA